jgi:hypothetical protein
MNERKQKIHIKTNYNITNVLKNKKRNYINCTSNNNNSIINFSRCKLERNVRK